MLKNTQFFQAIATATMVTLNNDITQISKLFSSLSITLTPTAAQLFNSHRQPNSPMCNVMKRKNFGVAPMLRQV